MFTHTTTWYAPKRPGFVSAWDSTRNAYGHADFDALDRSEQCKAVQRHVHSIPAKASTEAKRQPNVKARAIARRAQRNMKLDANSSITRSSL